MFVVAVTTQKNVGLLPYVIKAHHKPTYERSVPTNIAGTQQ